MLFSAHQDSISLLLDGGKWNDIPTFTSDSENDSSVHVSILFLGFNKKKSSDAAADGQHTISSVSWDSRLVNNSEQGEKFYKAAGK